MLLLACAVNFMLLCTQAEGRAKAPVLNEDISNALTTSVCTCQLEASSAGTHERYQEAIKLTRCRRQYFNPSHMGATSLQYLSYDHMDEHSRYIHDKLTQALQRD